MKKVLMAAAILTVSTTIMAEENIASQRLNESVISTENFETSVLDTAKNVTIVTQEDIQNKGASTVAEALRGVPGLDIRSMDGSDPVFDMRGSGATAGSNTLVLLDGVPLNNIEGRYFTSQIPIDQIEKIEVIPSGGAVMYGDGATGGVINIITKLPQDKKNYGSVNMEAGSWNTRKGTVNYGTKIGDKFLLDTSYTYTEGDGYRTPHPDYKDGDTKKSLWLRGRYLLDDGYLEMRYNYNKVEDSYSDYLTKEKFDDSIKQHGASGGKYKNISNEYTLTYNKKLSDKLSFLIYGGYTENDYRYKATYYPTAYNENKRNLITQYYIKPQLKYTYGKDSYVILGGDYKNGKVEDRVSKNPDKEKESYGGYILNKTTVGQFQFTQGYRKERSDFDYFEFSQPDIKIKKKFSSDAYELAANYLYSDTGSIYLSFTQGFRTPNADDLGAWYGDIDVQETKAYELGVKDMYKNTYISSSIFLIDTDNEIYLKKDPTDKDYGKYGKNTNFDGKVRRIGGQVSLQHYFDRLTLRENISYIQPKVTSGKYDGKEFAGVPRWNANLGATYNFTDNILGNLDIYYSSKTYSTDDFANKLGKDNDYITVDTNLKYNFENGLEIYTGIRNLFDKKYANIVTSNTQYKVCYPADGRSYYAGFKYNF
ncbi:TonB-dependent receptor family protein [Fusobacterium ulcerans]|uniref:TonB-dependent receptor family protein n=1 Tax=Fusobacterium ulcerans TaxID=861 RepID=UPI0010312BBC|nr:TonB-dependent receptor [Fusobacterium ulcerans]